MAKNEARGSAPTQTVREKAAELAQYRGHPCLIFVSQSLIHADVLTLRRLLGDACGDHLDLIVAGPGG